MLTLQPITRENLWDVLDLAVAPEQADWVTSNAVSIAQAKVQPECIPLAICSDDIPVGFIMYCIDLDDGEYWIYRLMIDARYQGRGYAQQALSQLLSLIEQDATHHRVFLGVHPEARAAVHVYQKMGFCFTGQIMGCESLMSREHKSKL
jgi:diamine N-acetyltransferase